MALVCLPRQVTQHDVKCVIRVFCAETACNAPQQTEEYTRARRTPADTGLRTWQMSCIGSTSSLRFCGDVKDPSGAPPRCLGGASQLMGGIDAARHKPRAYTWGGVIGRARCTVARSIQNHSERSWLTQSACLCGGLLHAHMGPTPFESGAGVSCTMYSRKTTKRSD